MSPTKPSRDYLECLHQWVEREKKSAGSTSKLARLIKVSRPAIYDWANVNIEQFIDETSRLKIFAYCDRYNRQPPYCLVDTASNSELEALMELETDLSKVARAISIGISKLGLIQPYLDNVSPSPDDQDFKPMASLSRLKKLLLDEMERQGMTGDNLAFAKYLDIKLDKLESMLNETYTPTDDEVLEISGKVANPDGQYQDYGFFSAITSLASSDCDPQDDGDRSQKNGKNSSNGATV